MKVFVFDTETTGLPPFRVSPCNNTAHEWPYIVQISFIIYDTSLNKLMTTYDAIVKVPNDVDIPEECANIHGITKEISLKQGYDICDVLNIFKTAFENCDIIVAHNINFDLNMILVETLRNKINVECLFTKTCCCTMLYSKELCNIKAVSKSGRTYIKYPSLKELHNKLFEIIPKNLHNSYIDTIICLRCYYYLIYNYDLCEQNCNFNALYKKFCV